MRQTNDRSAPVLLDTTKASVYTDPVVEGGSTENIAGLDTPL